MGREEKRAHRRLAMKVNVRCQRMDPRTMKEVPDFPEVFAATNDFSAGGLSFLTTEFWVSGAILRVGLEIPGEAQPIVCASKVIRSRYEKGLYRVGVVFLDISDEDRLRIESFVKKES